MADENKLNLLSYLRGTRGLNIRELAEKAGVSRNTIIRIEDGNKASIAVIGKIALALGVDLNDMNDLVESKENNITRGKTKKFDPRPDLNQSGALVASAICA